MKRCIQNLLFLYNSNLMNGFKYPSPVNIFSYFLININIFFKKNKLNVIFAYYTPNKYYSIVQ